MNAEISQVQRQIIGLYSKQLMYLRGKPRQFLNDLQHEARELMKVPKADEFSLHVAACIKMTPAAPSCWIPSLTAGWPG